MRVEESYRVRMHRRLRMPARGRCFLAAAPDPPPKNVPADRRYLNQAKGLGMQVSLLQTETTLQIVSIEEGDS